MLQRLKEKIDSTYHLTLLIEILKYQEALFSLKVLKTSLKILLLVDVQRVK